MRTTKEFSSIEDFNEFLEGSKTGMGVRVFSIRVIDSRGTIAVCIEGNEYDLKSILKEDDLKPILESAMKKEISDRTFDEHLAILTDANCYKNRAGEYVFFTIGDYELRNIAKYCRNISYEDGEKIIQYFYERSKFPTMKYVRMHNLDEYIIDLIKYH